jgi:hypothetical protein
MSALARSAAAWSFGQIRDHRRQAVDQRDRVAEGLARERQASLSKKAEIVYCRRHGSCSVFILAKDLFGPQDSPIRQLLEPVRQVAQPVVQQVEPVSPQEEKGSNDCGEWRFQFADHGFELVRLEITDSLRDVGLAVALPQLGGHREPIRARE